MLNLQEVKYRRHYELSFIFEMLFFIWRLFQYFESKKEVIFIVRCDIYVYIVISSETLDLFVQ
jgi:hypothetical protein